MKLMVRMTRQSDHTYRAWCPALPGCVVYGESIEEAREKIQKAVDGYLATLGTTLPRELAKRFRKESSNAA